MFSSSKCEPSAAGILLNEQGDEDTLRAILQAVRNLSESELEGLEEDLTLWSQTGFVGVHISELSTLLPRAAAVAEAA